ncbi:MAG: alanine racemase [Proteobacteria bacterium]|nr:alanine racemase [Pseudomonadota bacterium]HQR03111.1 alanine racemase [Rhodocyclaceae bacterium]
MPRPLRVRIDLAALRHNHAVARSLGGATRLWSVIKANAYGHGLGRVAAALADTADGFALIEVEGAVALREAGLKQPILMMEGFYDTAEIAQFTIYGLTPVLHCLEQVRQWRAVENTRSLPVYLKLNTGMNRLGFDAGDFRVALEMLREKNTDITLMTHFSDADEPRGIADQWSRFRAMTGGLDLPLCAANSPALIRYPEARVTWARPGIMLYGGSPFAAEQSAESLGLRPVMHLESRMLAIRTLQPGDRLGYGGAFVAERPMRIGIVAGGYGDGYPRHASTGTPILVAGQRTRTLGRVSMDKLFVDLTGIPGADLQSPVVLWGEGMPADDVAAAAGTVSYELFCALAARVPVEESA